MNLSQVEAGRGHSVVAFDQSVLERNSSMHSVSGVLRDFVGHLMEKEGALVEKIEPSGLEFVTPEPLAERLGLPAEGRLGFGPEFPPRALQVHFDSDWMERFGQVLGQRGRVLRRVLDLTTAPPSEPERLLEHTLVLQNAVYRLLNLVPAWTRYLILTFHYSAVSDEKREGILQLGVNLSNGSPLDSITGPLLQAVAARPFGSNSPLPEAALPPLWESRRLHQLIQVALPQRIRHELSPFLNSMQRRLERDMARLYEYYNDLHRESLTRLRKQVTDSSQSSRLETISREYQAKVADLRQKFALRIEVGWVQTLELILPVHRFELILKRRKGERRFHLDWNPLVRKLEQPPCEYSFTWESGRLICDDALHLVSIAAHAECPQCGKPYCRACHAEKCPRCTSQPHA
jgi:hypothetical protein